MIPSLFTFTLLSAVVLLLAGLPFLAIPEKIKEKVLAFPRNRPLGIILILLGGGWFVWKISQLGQSDFGDYKNLLMLLFGATILGTIFYVRDFLAVRGLAILILLSGNVGLKSAFGLYDIPQRLVLVTIIYIFLSVAIYVGVVPYKMRDWLNWLYAKDMRVRLLGGFFSLIALALVITAFQY